jgi:ribonucleotide reductase alpha subunit
MNINVIKRNGKKEPLMLDKILDRINQQTYGLDSKYILSWEIAQKVIEGITPGIETRILDILAMETSAALTTKHPDYSILAARLAITSLHKETKKSFSETIADLHGYINPKTGKHSPVISKGFNDLVQANGDRLDSAIVHSRDHLFDYFGYKVLEKSYLLKIDQKVAERPQYMFMRTSLQIWGNNIEKAIETYNLMSEGYYTHATPTLFNSGTGRPQLSSCFLLDVESDSIEGIFNTLRESAQISKNAGGIGIAFTKVRAKGTYISGTNGTSNGIIPFLKIYNETARAVDQCFTSETKVISNEGPKSISQIEIGDKVLTSDGEFHSVTNKMIYEKKEEEVVVIKTLEGTIRVTKEHQILVVRNLPEQIDRNGIIAGIKNGIYNVEWISAGDLQKNDRILRY